MTLVLLLAFPTAYRVYLIHVYMLASFKTICAVALLHIW